VTEPDVLTTTRRCLHGIAEHILTAHQWRVAGTIRLAVLEDGFATLALVADPAVIEVRGTELGTDRTAVPITGTLGDLADRIGVEFGLVGAPYSPTSGCSATDPAVVEGAAAAEIYSAWWAGRRAMEALASQAQQSVTPVLWPEHFDLGIALDEVNYGVSPGDDHLTHPYAYVGPWQPRVGDFWTESFGAARPLRELGDSQGVLEFFREGRARAAADPVAS